ncbi:MAG TPA: arginine--tRNA ligase [Candidatus Paceibacterota bacterium]|nr:arginine--tRNA ligase [Candidatus Paceibacterota bacterium]
MSQEIVRILKNIFGADTRIEVSVPDGELFGHYSTNFALRQAKLKGIPPLELAKEYAARIAAAAPARFFQKVEAAAPGFINFWLSDATMQKEFAAIARDKKYGAGTIGKGKTVIVEYSQPNIAKKMHVGHLRTTIIGAALANILELSGYRVVRWNYLGDWGTQFGKLIAAYKLWGNKKSVEKDPIEELQKLYVRFHAEMKSDPELEKRGQEEFKKLEEGDRENRKLWEWFKKESLKEFMKMYKTLDVDFDVWIGEAFFEREMKATVKELVDKNIAERSEGAVVAKLDAAGLPPALIQKSDGASLYLTRDIANLRYRLKKYKPAKILYVVGNEQALAFEQLFAIAALLGWNSAELKHIKYGLVLGAGGKKLSTREGTAQLLEGVIGEAVAKASEVIEVKNPDLTLAEKMEIAFTGAMGALKYNDLKENRTTDIIFNWEKMLDFSGDSAPYLQYTYARLKSILRKSQAVGAAESQNAKSKSVEPALKTGDAATLVRTIELALMRKLFEFPDIVERAGELYSTSTLATYLYKLAVATNKFYETTPILKDDDVARRSARLVLAASAARILQKGLGLLGIKTLEKI